MYARPVDIGAYNTGTYIHCYIHTRSESFQPAAPGREANALISHPRSPSIYVLHQTHLKRASIPIGGCGSSVSLGRSVGRSVESPLFNQ